MVVTDSSASLEHAPMTRFQVGAVLICMVLNLIDGFDVLAIAFAAPSLAKDWKLAPDALGVLLSAGLVGMTAGSILIAPLADRWGRRMMTLLTLLVVSIGMFSAAAASDTTQLGLARLFTGLGIGAMLPSINTIVAEYSSAERRELSLSVMSAGYPIGATLGGIAAIFISKTLGWRGIFVFGGVLSTVMVPLVLWRLPESLDFLFSKRPDGALDAANLLLDRLGRARLGALPEHKDAQVKRGLSDIVSGGLARSTLLLWLAFFMVMFCFYFVVSWTPKLLVEAGLPVNRGLSGGVLLNLGGIVGILMLGALSAKLGIFRLHTIALLAAAGSIAAFGMVSGALELAMLAALVVGFFIFTSMVGLYVITPSIYPTEVRNTGTGLAIGVGRCGAILSPILAGVLLKGGWKPAQAYIAFGLPALISAAAVTLLARTRR
jgi:benzoate transport